MWKTPRSVFTKNPITLVVDDSEDEGQYQHLTLHFGVLSDKSRGECLKTWPREAIKVAREHLDRFEAWLEGDA